MSTLRAVIFDTDGVLLDSAALHAAAWKSAFDGCLDTWAPAGGRQSPFDAELEYRGLVDGKPRHDGALAFLTARRIALPEGAPDDPPGCGTVWAVATRKEHAFMETLRTRPVEPFDDVRPALGRLRNQSVRCAAVSASRHARPLLESAGLAGLFDALADGVDADRLGLAGKPDPALFLEAADRLGIAPARAAVVEDALAGVEAGRRGHFGLVVGISRTRAPEAEVQLRAHGADVVFPSLTAVAEKVCGAVP
ncbi:HAD family hydrolase [Streptomyces erythrochromogenes]|uniref:HAD family hydrolase n=1 Tax=Streptomyces erythrochromogenes TaxID=285574 RepID=UPI0037FD46B6